MNPDLARERAKASFNVEELTNLIDGGKARTQRRRYLEKIVTSNKNLSDPIDTLFMDRTQQYERTLQRGMECLLILNKYNITDTEDIYTIRKMIGVPMPFNLHFVMFLPCLESMATKEQQAKWLPLAKNYKILGTYAQTELGHGSNVRGLETTATYDKVTKEFVIHTPQLSACKWWPGFLAHTSTHALVAAQLIVDGRKHGVQFFIVQLRDLNNHRPLPGITLGDIGPKSSAVMNGTDNGFLMLNHVRIPRENMLMALTKVSPNGQVSSSGNSKLVYGTMMYVRSVIPADMARTLSMAITIAIRYSAVRRQGELKPGAGEIQILDYKTQQYQLLPILAAAYAMKFCSVSIKKEHTNLMMEIEAGNYSRLQEMHTMLSGFKAFFTSLALHSCEACRLCCGGHGYSMLSNLPELYNICSGACIYEGENKVLFLQVARYLLKCVRKVLTGQGQLPPTVAYLTIDDNGENIPAFSMEQFLNPSIQLQVIQMQSRRMMFKVAQKMQGQVMNGMDEMDAWNANSQDLLKSAQAHSFYLTVLYFTDFLRDGLANIGSSNRKVLKSLCDLYILHRVIENSGSFLEVGVLNTNQLGLIKDQVELLIDEIRPDAVALVDSFDICDRVLNSALGKYDGKVYEQLFEWAQKDPVNKQQVRPGYYKYIKPLLQHGKSKL